MGIKRRFAQWVMDQLDEPTIRNQNNCYPTALGSSSMKSSSQTVENNCLSSQGLSFKVYPGLGGVAIETYLYNQKNGDTTITLYIVPEGEDLSDTLSKIVTLDTMRMG